MLPVTLPPSGPRPFARSLRPCLAGISRRPPAPRALGRVSSAALSAALAAVAWLAGVPVALAHGAAEVGPPGPGIVLDWRFDPTVQLPVLLAAALYLLAVRRVDAAHPANPVPLRRPVAFVAGLVAIELALQSGIEHYDTTLFSFHMVQHILLMFFAAPLIALSAPITLLLRAVRPEIRTRYVLPILHSRVVRVISFPIVTWIFFAVVMWGTHFSPLFNLSLENPLVHDLEHALFLVSALLFWWPVVGIDPSPWRLPYPLRVLYTFLQMPQNTFLSLAIFSASAPLYEHYATLERTWGPTALADQQMAGAIMWVVGDLTFVTALVLVVVAWMRAEERTSAADDARVEREEAVLRDRADALAGRGREEPGREPAR